MCTIHTRGWEKCRCWESGHGWGCPEMARLWPGPWSYHATFKQVPNLSVLGILGEIHLTFPLPNEGSKVDGFQGSEDPVASLRLWISFQVSKWMLYSISDLQYTVRYNKLLDPSITRLFECLGPPATPGKLELQPVSTVENVLKDDRN